MDDKDRKQFLDELNKADHVKITGWESIFIDGFLKNVVGRITLKQREVIDGMVAKYEKKL